jgi:Ca2+-dependent lipid-binding protein
LLHCTHSLIPTGFDPNVFVKMMGTDGGKNPTFHEKFQIPLIEGLRELEIAVWNSNTFSRDDFIGTGRYTSGSLWC